MSITGTTSTRVAAALSLLALICLTVSDFVLTGFWDKNAMATSVIADILVLIVGVAVVNEFLAARSRSRWRLVADYSLVELSSECRRVWVQLAETIGLGRREELSREDLRALLESPADDDRSLERCAHGFARDPDCRRELERVVGELVETTREALTSWAPVLPEAPYSGALSRYARSLYPRVKSRRLTANRAAVAPASASGWQCATNGRRSTIQPSLGCGKEPLGVVVEVREALDQLGGDAPTPIDLTDTPGVKTGPGELLADRRWGPPASKEEVKPGASLDLTVGLGALEKFVDRVLFVEEPPALGEEITEALHASPDLAAEKPGLKVLGDDLLHHRLGARMPLEDGQVLLKDRYQLIVRENRGHRSANPRPAVAIAQRGAPDRGEHRSERPIGRRSVGRG